MKLLVITCSLNPESKSCVAGNEVYERLKVRVKDVDIVHLQDYELPMCDGGACYKDENVIRLTERIAQADGVIVAYPIYNYNCNAAAKNLVELTGRAAWGGKVVGFVAVGGAVASYMSMMTLPNNLMMDFRCVIIPRFVYMTGKAFNEKNEIVDEHIVKRLDSLAEDCVRYSEACKDIKVNFDI